MKKNKPTLLLVGCGHLGQAMLQSWQKKLNKKFRLIVVGTQKPKDLLKSTTYLPAMKQLPKDIKPSVILFAVRPQQLNDVAKKYQRFAKSSLFITVVAGKTIASLEKVLGSSARIIRAMPNLPASIGQAVTGVYANQNATKSGHQTAHTLLSAFGAVIWIGREHDLNAVTAISGSGPGYVFLFADAMISAAQSLGLSKTVADQLVRHTLAGAGNLLKATSTSTTDLCKAVATKGGTTDAAFQIFNQQKQFQKLVTKALQAAAARAKALSQKS